MPGRRSAAQKARSHGGPRNHRGTHAGARHRPLDGGDVPDFLFGPRRCASRRRLWPARWRTKALRARRVAEKGRAARVDRIMEAVPLDRHLVHLAQPGRRAAIGLTQASRIRVSRTLLTCPRKRTLPLTMTTGTQLPNWQTSASDSSTFLDSSGKPYRV